MLLVHKESRGVLELPGIPAEIAAELDDWWEVHSSSSLARKIRRLYPCFDPLTNKAGALLDVVPWGKRRIKRVDRGGPADIKRDWRHSHDKKSRLYRRRS